jgi:hypothetical protein
VHVLALRALCSLIMHGLTMRVPTLHVPCRYAVQWMVQTSIAADINSAVWLGNQMLAAGLIHHVQHTGAFKASTDLYQFYLIDTVEDDDDMLRNKCDFLV